MQKVILKTAPLTEMTEAGFEPALPEPLGPAPVSIETGTSCLHSNTSNNTPPAPFSRYLVHMPNRLRHRVTTPHVFTSPVPEVGGTAPEAAGRGTSWKRRQHGAVGAGEVWRPGRRGARAGAPRRPQDSPPASRPGSPGTRSARAPRLNNATLRPTPRSRIRSCSLGAAQVAASVNSAWTSGGSWSR